MTVPTAGQPVQAMVRWAEAMLRYVGIIGRVSSVSMSTHTHEDARIWRPDEISALPLLTEVGACLDAASVVFICDLVCRSGSGEQIVIDRGMMSYVEFANRETPDPTVALESTIILDTDIYAAITWGVDRNNHDLARLNAPDFNRFLTEFIDAVDGDDPRVDAPDYSGQVDQTGFKLPA